MSARWRHVHGIVRSTLCPIVFTLALAAACPPPPSAAAPARAPARSAPGAPDAPADDAEVRLLFLGDVTVGRYVGAAMAARGADAPFDRARDWLSAADIAVANLEGPLVPPGAAAIPPPSPGLLDLTGRTASAAALARAGFDVLSVANNHSLDAGPPGLAHTARALRSAGIAPIGLQAAVPAPLVRDVRGVRVGFLAYTLVLNPTTTPDRAAAAIAVIDPFDAADVARAADEVAAARRTADVVAVALHWGAEYAARPSAGQERLARRLADAGADILVGAHPHVVQDVAVLGGAAPSGAAPRPSARRRSIVAYSLGNALFDQGGDAATRRGAALECGVGPDGVVWARLLPLAIRSGPNGYSIQPPGDGDGRDVGASRTGSPDGK